MAFVRNNFLTEVTNLGPVARKVDRVVHQTVIFFNRCKKAEHAMTPGILRSQEMKSDFNSKMLNFNIGSCQLLNMFRKYRKEK